MHRFNDHQQTVLIAGEVVEEQIDYPLQGAERGTA
jgi:hypothetical protein